MFCRPHSAAFCLAASAALTFGSPSASAGTGAAPHAATDTAAADAACKGAPCRIDGVNMSSGIGPLPANSPALAVDPADPRHLLAAATDYNCPESLQAIYNSFDRGTTWSTTCMGRMVAGFGAGYPVPAFDSRGVAYVAGAENVNGGTLVVALVKSTDRGVSWSEPTYAAGLTLGPGSSAYKPWLEIDRSPASPFRDSLYVSAGQNAYDRATQISVSRSRDGGISWTTVNASRHHAYPALVDLSDLAVGRDGTVYLSYLECDASTTESFTCAGAEARMTMQRSTDGGATWSDPVRMATVSLTPLTQLTVGSCVQFYGCLPNTVTRSTNVPAIAVDSSEGSYGGRLYATMVDDRGGHLRVVMVVSADGGRTWSRPRVVSRLDNGRDQFMPWIGVSEAGVVGITWLDRRHDRYDLEYDAYAAVSTDGGESFSPATKLTRRRSDPWRDGFGGEYLGDYTGNAWSGDTLFMTYPDTRFGISKPFIAGVSR